MLFFCRPLAAAAPLKCLLAILVAVCLAAPFAWAGSGDVYHLPMNNRAKLRAKLRLNVDTRWVDGTGYRPIKIEAVPAMGPSAEDRQIRVTLRPMGQSQREVSTLIDIPQGSRSASAVMLLPQDELWHNIGITVTEDGDRIEELSEQWLSFTRTNYWSWTEASPAVLFVDSDVPPRPQRDVAVGQFRATAMDPKPTHNLPDYRNFVRTFPESNYANLMVAANGSQKVSDTDLLSQMNDVARAELLPPAELPQSWMQLTSLDMIFLSQGDLDAMAKDHPKRFEAIREWLQAGSVLVVYGVGDKFERLAEVEKRLKLASVPQLPDAEDKYRGWSIPDLRKRFAGLPQTMYSPQTYGNNYAQVVQAQMEAAGGEPADFSGGKAAPETWPFLAREAGLGYVVAIGAENPFPADQQYWTWMLHTVPNEHWMWFRRNGMSMHRTNDDFWNFLIPGVGVAPVVSFLLLITLFAAIIGPVNYILLGRWQRLYLLLITVPVGAALVTGGLFFYALATDGVGVRGRVRSFTEIDPTTGHAVSWSRQSYYASIAPSKGLVFPEDAAVFPMIHEPIDRNGRRSYNQKLSWDDGQQLRAGYLPSRSATQFLVVRPGPTQSRLVVQPQAGGKPPRVTNQLGTEIKLLIVADQKSLADGAGDKKSKEEATDSGSFPFETPQTYWQVETLKAGEAAEAKEVSVKEVHKRLNRIYRDNAPAYPKGYDPRMHNNAMEFMFYDYARYVNVDAGQSPPTMATGVLERQLSRLASKSDAVLEPGTFLAITDSPPEVPLGNERTKQNLSLHVVHGRWGDR